MQNIANQWAGYTKKSFDRRHAWVEFWSAALGIAAGVPDDIGDIIDFLKYAPLVLDGNRKAVAVIGELLVGEDGRVVGVLAGEQVNALPLGLDLAENKAVILLVRVVKRIGLIHGKLLLPYYVAGGIGPANGFRRGRDAVGTAGQKKEQAYQKTCRGEEAMLFH